MKNYFTTGEFAKLCRVKKQTLFHYDDKEILQPELIGENGYRYYSYKQLEEFSMISMLKDLEMPLSEIKKYVDKRSPENLISLLEREADEAEKKMSELKWIQQYIRTKLMITRSAEKIKYGKIFIEECPDEYFLVTEFTGPENDRALATAMTRHLNYCHEKDIYSAYAVGGMVRTADMAGAGYRYSHLFTRIDEEGHEHNHVKKAGRYLCCCDDRGYHRLPEIAGRLAASAKRRDLKIGDYYYEDVLLDELSGKTDDDYSVKLSVRVE